MLGFSTDSSDYFRVELRKLWLSDASIYTFVGKNKHAKAIFSMGKSMFGGGGNDKDMPTKALPQRNKRPIRLLHPMQKSNLPQKYEDEGE